MSLPTRMISRHFPRVTPNRQLPNRQLAMRMPTSASSGRITMLIVGLVVLVGAVVIPQELAWSEPQTRAANNLSAEPGTVVNVNFPATHVAVEWSGDPGATVELRADEGEWQVAQVDEPSNGKGRVASGLLLVDNAKRFETRVTGEASDVRLWVFDTENGPRKLVVKETPADALYGQSPQPHIVSRAGWGADESLRRGAPDFAPISRVVIHHTATPNSDSNPAATIRGMYQYHVQGNGWNDLGYNFVIDRNGTIYEGRYARNYFAGEMPTGTDTQGRGVIGAHALDNNTGTVGISLLGTYTSVAPTPAQQASLERLLAWKADSANINLDVSSSMVAHRDVNQTTCPGDVAYALIGRWRSSAAATVRTYSIPPVPGNIPGNTPGYWIASTAGSVRSFGNAENYGSMAGQPLNSPVSGIIATASRRGYWLTAADGGIFSFGDAAFYGSMGGLPLNKPVVGLSPTKSGKGYWLVAADGGIFAFGDAGFYGSMGGKPLNEPVVGIAPTSSGKGYWLVAADGGIFAFGDAGFYGSMGGKPLNRPVAGMTRPEGRDGYWLFADDGGVFTFGNNIGFYGSIPGVRPPNFSGTTQAIASNDSQGYYVLSRSGAVYSFGDARFHGAGLAGGGLAAGIALSK